ncbi:hypothetical protein GYMLUDRAFT_42243 [Collybiopsis luxurians FD-317 M1]|uniref:Uncharacterized protein n=1 Tax=Collybiopsis luxurians FD-317 M1 TaxID=944289 RepID=A0A0D0C2G2_9AGAR|nr:hypothetical protein GYMLUDRAFT_42243 [Collybiopsis luxurians FD-317 M1]
MALTDEESAILSHIGTLIYYGIVVLIVDCTLYGFYLLAEFIALYLFIKHGLKQRIQQVLFVTSVATLLTASWDFVNQCALNLIQIKVSLMEPLDAGLAAQADAAQRAILPWFVMMAWPINLNIIIGNGVVLWRAWAVCHEQKSVRSALIAMGWVNTGICLSDAIVDTVIRTRDKGAKTGNTALDTAQLFICLVINMVATGLILTKAWQNPVMVKEYLEKSKNRRERFEKVILVMTESGVFLLLFQLLWAIFGRINMTAAQFSPVNIAWLVIETMFNEITILYAMAVIIMVIIDRSALDKLFVLKTTINVTTSEKNAQATKISTLRFAEGRQVTSATTSTGLGSDIEAQGDSHSDIGGNFKEKSHGEISVTQ